MHSGVFAASYHEATSPVAHALACGATYIYDLTGFYRTNGRFPARGFVTIPRAEMPPPVRLVLDECAESGIGLWVEGVA